YRVHDGPSFHKVHLVSLATKRTLNLLEFHTLVGHLNFDTCINISKNKLVDDLPDVEIPTVRPFCDVCAKAKATRHPFPKESMTEYRNYGDKVVSDLWGPA
ncbi:hypothetical protein GGU10DRAFT_234353, partial [Lentinula aff. detonsa]